MWLHRSHTAPLPEVLFTLLNGHSWSCCRMWPPWLPPHSLLSPLCAHTQILKPTGIHDLLLFSCCKSACQQGASGGQVRIPEEYTAPPPSTTVCLPPPQVGALLWNLTASPTHPPHRPLTCAHTHPSTLASPHTCAPCKPGTGPQISKLLMESQPSRGLRAGGRLLQQSPVPLHSCAGPWPLPGNKAGINKRRGSLP